MIPNSGGTSLGFTPEAENKKAARSSGGFDIFK
jgi:hypothetical protein